MLLESRPAGGGLWRSQFNLKLFQPKAISVGSDRCKVFPGFNCNFDFSSLTLPMQSQSHRCHMSRCSATLVVGACLPTSGRSVSMQLRGLLDVDTAQGSLCGDQGRDVLKGGPMDLWTYGLHLGFMSWFGKD